MPPMASSSSAPMQAGPLPPASSTSGSTSPTEGVEQTEGDAIGTAEDKRRRNTAASGKSDNIYTPALVYMNVHSSI